jgi:hypothetical protein
LLSLLADLIGIGTDDFSHAMLRHERKLTEQDLETRIVGKIGPTSGFATKMLQTFLGTEQRATG